MWVQAWPVGSLTAWSLATLLRPPKPGSLDFLLLLVGVLSAVAFQSYLLMDPGFSWGDIFYMCGAEFQFCTCSLRWNALGWARAITLWCFIHSAALGMQKAAIELGLGGMLPGEDVVTRESFISIGWRLIPYWLNNWEQSWGAESSSMMFELPHFAAELLIVLPCVQILCARLKILALPQVRVTVPQTSTAPTSRRNVAANFVRGHWEYDPAQARRLPRLRANLRCMLFAALLAGATLVNALHVPLWLEDAVVAHPRTAAVLSHPPALPRASLAPTGPPAQPGVFSSARQDLTPGAGIPEYAWTALMTPPRLAEVHAAFHAPRAVWEWTPAGLRVREHACGDAASLRTALAKHAVELAHMRDPGHRALVPVVEASLAVMRLSCEKLFVLLALLSAYLLGPQPRALRRLIALNSTLSSLLQRIILYSFPAVCWLYGAGCLFSAFVSVVFWSGPLMHAYETVLRRCVCVRPRHLRPAGREELERMGGACAICWGAMDAAGGPEPDAAAAGEAGGGAGEGAALPCGHAYHGECLTQWLRQCHIQARAATCPMCQGVLDLELRWRWPWGGGAEAAEEPPVVDAWEPDPFMAPVPGAAAQGEGRLEEVRLDDLQALLGDIPLLGGRRMQAHQPGN